MKHNIAVIGAGMVGICTALELQRQGQNVTLFDRRDFGQETSQWNAGVLARSSLLPLNNPALFKLIPKALLGKLAGLRLTPQQMLLNVPWLTRFLLNSWGTPFNTTVQALDNLIQLSLQTHKTWLSEFNCNGVLQDKGWLFLYRNEKSFQAAQFQRDLYQQFAVKHEVLDTQAIKALEPSLTTDFAKATWIQDAYAAVDPRSLLSTYMQQFLQTGGQFRSLDIETIEPQAQGFKLHTSNQKTHSFDQIVLTTGAWTNQLLKSLNVQLPLMVERGYLMKYALQPNTQLERPIYDVANGYVLSPRPEGVQLSTGVDLTRLHTKPNDQQLKQAEQAARNTLSLGNPILDKTAIGNRPTLPDNRPVIGELKQFKGLWLACGHQHIGFSTGAGTAKLLSSQLLQQAPPIPAEPFSPSRFGL